MTDDGAASPVRPLEGRVCVVAGSSRGVGLGVARALGEAGATVICSARSTRFGQRTQGRPETIEDAAEAVEEAGGRGLPYLCDHTDPKALYDFAAWVLRRWGPPHLLVNSVWGGAEGFDGRAHADGTPFGTPFHKRPLASLERALSTGPYALLATARAFLPVMAPAKAGLVVAVGFDAQGQAVADAADALGWGGMLLASQIIARDAAVDGIAAVHLSPGFVRSERVAAAGLAAQATESPHYAGRAVAALAADPLYAAWSGRSLFVADLARHYGFTDEDGSRPERYRPAD